MIPDLTGLFDPYSRQARLYPALLVFFPVLVLVGACMPKLVTSPGMVTLFAVCAACGVLYLFTNIVRGLGKRIEQKLLKSWGGWPTTEMLRWAGPVDHLTLRRYHSYLQSRLPALTFPDEAFEYANPYEADGIYASAVRWLKEQCRGTDYALVEKENAQYGFRRNTLGARPLAITVCSICLVYGLGFLIFRATGFHGEPVEMILLTARYITISPILGGAIAVIGLMFAWWIFGVTPKWVRQAGREYAYALLATCEK